jgi:nucleoside-diphosphate-sugar epimerase
VMPDSTPHLFCFGFGYSARALADAVMAEGWRVSGTQRTAGAGTSVPEGVTIVPFARAQPLSCAPDLLSDVTHLLSSVPPDGEGDPVIDWHFFDLARLEQLAWVGYFSTTGVYGDTGGAWVDEAAPCAPSGERGARRVVAEGRWIDLWHGFGLPVHVFRLAGIYGPGRNALAQAARGEARRIVKPGQLFSRIHRDDIVATVRASMARPEPGALYNVCDDNPAPADEVVTFACELLGIDPPPEIPFDDAELSDMARSFYADNRRVRNERIKAELGVTLSYPDYQTGLRALAAAGEGSG